MGEYGPDAPPPPLWALVAGLVFLLLVFAFLVWASAKAPCGALDWMPTKDVPARCLST